MIKAEGITKVIRKKTLVKDATFSVEDGSIAGIVGRNGSGKTVLLKIMCGFMLPTEGAVEVNGERVGKDVDFPSSLGAIIETPGFLPWQTAEQCLMDFAKLGRKAGRTEVLRALELVGLEPGSKKHVGNYSLGMRQRLAIAQAVMEDPDVLVLDEPMNGLDIQGVEDVRKILLQMKQAGKTILITSHNREDIAVLCDQVYEMDAGSFLQN